MSANQPMAPQPTAQMKFLKHTLLSFAMGILFAVLTAIGNYVYTAGNAIDIKVVASVAGAAFLAYLLSHFISVACGAASRLRLKQVVRVHSRPVLFASHVERLLV